MSTFYDELEVSPKASQEVIQGAYRSLVKRYHPDVNPGNAHAAERMRRVNDAFAILSDPAKRAAYDAELGRSTASVAPDVNEREHHGAERERENVAWQAHRDAEARAVWEYQQQQARAWHYQQAQAHAAATQAQNASLVRWASRIGGLIVAAALVAFFRASFYPDPAPPVVAKPAPTFPTITETAEPPAATTTVARYSPPSHVNGGALSVDDELTITMACRRHQANGDVSEFVACKRRQQDIAASTEPADISDLPIDVQLAIGRACQRYQSMGDLAGRRACMRRNAAEAR